MSDAAQALGLKLKAERERRGVSAQKMADDMHLDGWVIEALEAGDYQRIGPAVFAKGHLKNYASLLGVSAVDSPAAPDAKQPPVGAPVPIIRLDQPASAGRLPGRVLAGAAVAAALVGGGVWLRPWHAASGPKAPAAAHPNPAAASEAANKAASGAANKAANKAASEAANGAANGAASEAAPSDGVTPPVSAADGDTALPSAPAESAAAIAATGAVQTVALSTHSPKPGPEAGAADLTPGVGRARLRLSFSADSRVDIYDFSGKHIFTGNGRANSVTTIAGIAPFRVYLGFASGVQLQVNDRAVAIGPQFVTGDVARFEAGADGVLRRETRPAPSDGAPAVAASPRG
jgi:cytoskeleton protein RodZ